MSEAVVATKHSHEAGPATEARPKTERWTGNKVFAEALEAYGVDHFFHVPVIMPGAVIEMTARGLKPIVAHTEKAAAYMADGYARASGRLGVCGSQAIGAANLAAGLLDAYMARSPVLAVTGSGTPGTREKNFYQESDQRGFFAGLTKMSSHVGSANRFADLLRQAVRTAVSGQPGPTHLEIAGFWGSLGTEEAPKPPSFEPEYGVCPPLRLAGDPVRIEALAKRLAAAARPIVVAGSGIRASQAAAQFLAFVRKAQIPVTTSLDAKAAIPDSEPLSVGVVGDYSRDTANMAVSEADFVLFVGTTTGSMVTRNWTIPAPEVAAAQIDIEPRELGRNYPLEIGVVGDPGAVLDQLAAIIKPSSDRKAWLARIKDLRRKWAEQTAELEASSASPLRPERIMRELSDALPEGALVVADTGHSAAWAARHLYLDKRGQGLLRAAGSLGWSFPASLGAKCGQPDRPVVCFTGDGGFMYHMAEMETALRYGIRTVTVINNNASFSQERFLWHDQQSLERNWRFFPVDFAGATQAFGCAAFRVVKAGELAPALRAAFAADRPAVIEVMSDPMVAAPPSWAPGLPDPTYAGAV
jgi:acetolactate synthase I/II/III large subunit